MNSATRMILGGFLSLLGVSIAVSVVGSAHKLYSLLYIGRVGHFDGDFNKEVFAQVFVIVFMGVLGWLLLKYGIRNVKKGIAGPAKKINNDSQMADSEDNYDQF